MRDLRLHFNNMLIQNLNDANEALKKYMPAVKYIAGKDITLDRMTRLMSHIGNPQDNLKVIHIAGTSGKTSTSYYTASLLQHMGLNVGLTVSPHIDSVTERIQINGMPLNEAEFCKSLNEFLQLIETSPVEPTYFELLMAFAYWVFNKKRVDVAVIETGLGGMHDGSNVAKAKNKICVITDIGFDHMHILGNTISDIAAQKAGIIHDQNVVCMHRQPHAVMQAVRERILLKDADLHIVADDLAIANNLPLYQKRNFILALYAVNIFLKRQNKICSNKAIIESIKTYIPGRMDMVQVNNKTIVFDGAHNQQKMRAFVATMKQRYPNKTFVVMLAMKKGKEYTDVLTELKPIIHTLIVTEFVIKKEVNTESQNAATILQFAQNLGITAKVITDTNIAYKTLISLTSDIGVVTGSLYLIAQLREENRKIN